MLMGCGQLRFDRFAEPASAENERRKAFANMHPVGRMGKSEEVASALLYLCSPGACFITGTDMLVDGGFIAT